MGYKHIYIYTYTYTYSNTNRFFQCLENLNKLPHIHFALDLQLVSHPFSCTGAMKTHDSVSQLACNKSMRIAADCKRSRKIKKTTTEIVGNRGTLREIEKHQRISHKIDGTHI